MRRWQEKTLKNPRWLAVEPLVLLIVIPVLAVQQLCKFVAWTGRKANNLDCYIDNKGGKIMNHVNDWMFKETHNDPTR